MKKTSFLSIFLVLIGTCLCVSCGYLFSNALVTSSLFKYSSSVSNEDQTVYAISLAKNTDVEELENMRCELQQQNGAGYIYQQNEEFHLIASVYDNINDAELVKNNLKSIGKDCQIISIELERLTIAGNFSAEEKTILLECLKSDFNTFKTLYDVAISLDTGVFDLTKAKLECNNIFSSQVATKTNLETFFKDNTNKNLSSLRANLASTNEFLSNLISENYENTTQTFSSLIKLTYCKILFE